MTDRVKHLHAVPPPAPKPDPDVVALCKLMLREAEAGQIRAIAVALDLADDSTSFHLEVSECGTRARSLLGALVLLEDEVKAISKKPEK